MTCETMCGSIRCETYGCDRIEALRGYRGDIRARCSDRKSEPDGLPCPGVLTFKPDDLQAKCPVCGGWTGVMAPGVEWLP